MYYIMSYNTINGFCSGAFQDIDHLFYGSDQSSEFVGWVPLLTEAQAFATAADAEAVINSTWGSGLLSVGILFVREDAGLATLNDESARSKLNARAEVSRRLVSGTVTKKDLVEMKNDMWRTNALTYREKWIIDILTKDD